MAGKRRGNNEGSIVQRSDGRWMARVTLPDGSRRSLYGKTRAEVAGKLTDALGDVKKGKPLPAEKETVGAYLSRWLSDVCRPAVRPSTYEGYEVIVRLHVSPRIGKLKLARLSPQDLAKLYRELADAGLSPRTVQLTHAVLHKALDQALRWDLVARNPADLVDPPRVERKETTVLSREQAKLLLDRSQDEPLHALYAVALTGGLREGEVLALTWEDVDWEHGTVQVRRQLTRVRNEGFKFTEPKTKKGRRTVALPDVAMGALKRHRTAQVEERLRATAWEENGLVFCNGVGRPLERQNVMRRSFKPLLERLGLPDLRFHDLRHSAATLLLGLGEHPKVVQERLGHATISITMDVYSHVMPTMQREAARKLDGLFVGEAAAAT